MDKLTEYLTISSSRLRETVRRAEQLTDKGLELLLSTSQTQAPYEIDPQTGVEKTGSSPSVSTNLMIAHALTSELRGDATVLLPRRDRVRRPELEKELSVHAASLVSAIVPMLATSVPSSTFDENSVHTGIWVAEMAALVPPGAQQDALRTGCGHIVARYQHDAPAFVRLRHTQFAVSCNSGGMSFRDAGAGFLSTLHDHLSFYRIPDSRFDPAELAFSLEGALLAESKGGPVIELHTIRAALSVLVKCQRRTAHWRPGRPILWKNTGLVLFPVSVEVASSILRSTALLDHLQRTSSEIGEQVYDAICNYIDWLDSRSVRTHSGALGWHSEHINNADLIHPWETSQVLTFLSRAVRAIEQQLARTALGHSRIQSARIKEDWFEDLSRSKVGPEFDFVTRIESSFIDPGTSYSALLYGPPGTGKTTVARKLAARMGVPLLSLSVSDFLADPSQLERRAKEIFEVLEMQENVVILFDEIDHLLLDRDSSIYFKLETVFQFVTPGMLTKIQSLRTSKRVRFLVATNYEYRIDSAIKRTGRIDHHILVLPMDQAGRESLLAKALTSLSPEDSDVVRLAKNCLYLTYTDIKKACKEGIEQKLSLLNLGKHFERYARSCDLRHYSKLSTTEEQTKTELGAYTVREIVGMIALWFDAQPDLGGLTTNQVAAGVTTPLGATWPRVKDSQHFKDAIALTRDDLRAAFERTLS